MLNGINHLTLAITQTHLEKSIYFYQTLLGMKLHAKWNHGAYISCGDLWLCLSVDTSRQHLASSETDYTHYAFSISESNFPLLVNTLKENKIVMWKENKSEGDSFYFLDPDGHKLELHVGDLSQRLKSCQFAPYDGMEFY